MNPNDGHHANTLCLLVPDSVLAKPCLVPLQPISDSVLGSGWPDGSRLELESRNAYQRQADHHVHRA